MAGRVEAMAAVRNASFDLDALYREHAPGARRLAYLLTGDAALAEDLTHDAFVKVAGRLRSLRDPEAFGAYLHRTVVNLARSSARSAARREARQRRAARLGASPEAEPDEPHEGDGPVWVALRRLPARQRTALVLRHGLDLSEQRTAEILGCAPGTVKSLTSRGLQALREELADV